MSSNSRTLKYLPQVYDRLFLPLFRPLTSYLHPEELELLKPTMVLSAVFKTTAAAAADGETKLKAGEELVTLIPSSKKEASVRRRELLAYVREPLREACSSHAGMLMRSKFAGNLVLLEAARVRLCMFCVV